MALEEQQGKHAEVTELFPKTWEGISGQGLGVEASEDIGDTAVCLWGRVTKQLLRLWPKC